VPVFTLTFLNSTSSAYRDAVRLARMFRSHQVIPRGRRVEHQVTVHVTPGELAWLTELWRLVGAWKGTLLVLNGAPLPPARGRWILDWLGCMSRAATFDPPHRYCRSGIPSLLGTGFGQPRAQPDWYPCRLWAERHGASPGRINWADLERRLDQVRAALTDLGLAACPFLDLEAFAHAIREWEPGLELDGLSAEMPEPSEPPVSPGTLVDLFLRTLDEPPEPR